MSGRLRVLIVEDSVGDTFFIVRELQCGGFEVDFERVETAAMMKTALEIRNDWDLIISDYRLPQFSGSAALALYQRSGLDIPFIIVSGAMGEEVAVQILKSGAHNYVTKEHLDRLVPAVLQELQEAAARRIRSQAEAAAAYLASLVQSCDDAIVGETLEGKIVYWNAGAKRLFGYTAAEMMGRSVSLLIPPQRPEELAGIFEKLARGESVEKFETVRVHKNGRPLEVAMTVSPVKDGSGRLIGASVVARNIVKDKQAEKEHLALIQELTAALVRTNLTE